MAKVLIVHSKIDGFFTGMKLTAKKLFGEGSEVEFLSAFNNFYLYPACASSRIVDEFCENDGKILLAPIVQNANRDNDTLMDKAGELFGQANHLFKKIDLRYPETQIDIVIIQFKNRCSC